MRNKSVDDLTIAELEALIRQRQARRRRAIPARGPDFLQPALQKPAKTGRTTWEKILLLAEITALVAVLLVTGVSARGWMALRQKLPLDGVAIVGETALAAPPTNTASESTDLPPIGWRNDPLAGQGLAPVEQRRPLDPPDRLRRYIQSTGDIPTVPIPEQIAPAATRIVIPSIGVDAPVGEGTDWESLKYKVGHHPGTANPGQRGNMVLAAHNDIYGEIFRYLPDVPVGEIISVYAGDETFQYRITGRRIITPDQVEVMLPTTGPTVTLISCYPYLIDTHRIVLFGELVR